MLSAVSSCNTVALDRGTIQCSRILKERDVWHAQGRSMLSLIIGDTDVSNVLHVGLGGGGVGVGGRSAAVAAGVWVWPTLLDGFQGKVARGRGGGRERERGEIDK